MKSKELSLTYYLTLDKNKYNDIFLQLDLILNYNIINAIDLYFRMIEKLYLNNFYNLIYMNSNSFKYFYNYLNSINCSDEIKKYNFNLVNKRGSIQSYNILLNSQIKKMLIKLLNENLIKKNIIIDTLYSESLDEYSIDLSFNSISELKEVLK